ncbi:heat intolerant 4-like protein [Tanacetum coccineum]
MFPAEPPVVCEFDWEFDELEEFANELIASEELTEDHKDEFKEFVKEKVREAKRANREAREKRKKAGEEMDQNPVAAFENMRFYKFYPVATPDTPASEVKSSFINRYYGKAHQVLSRALVIQLKPSPNNGMHYVEPLPPPPPSARLAAARAAIEAQAAATAADPTTGEEEAATGSKIQVEDPNPASAASSGEN